MKKLILVAKRSETEGVTSFMFRSDTPITWQAGQFLHYSLPHPGADERGITRYTPFDSYPLARRSKWASRMAIS